MAVTRTDTIVWHPVTDPPPYTDDYLVTFISDRNGARCVAKMLYLSDENRFCHNYAGKVRAWAEIPKPYEG